MPEPTTVLSYIRSNTSIAGDNFIRQWGSLTDADKAQMQVWAREEMAILGIPVKS